MLEILLLSIIQGITEFLPVSSSAHLILFSNYLISDSQNLTLDISLHSGSLLAVILFFKEEILNFFQNKYLFLKILISSLPIMIAGFVLIKLNLLEQLRNIYAISITTILFGLLLYYSDKFEEKNNIKDNLSIKGSLYIGFIQILSLIPGVSRSGITMTVARLLKFNRIDSAKISFLLSIPTLLAVSTYNIFKILELENIQITIENFWGMFLSFIFSFITLKFFIKFLKKFSLFFFMVYRVILGLVILIYVSY